MKPKLLTTLKGYQFSDLLRDSAAGLTVAMVAIPLSLAIAIASGAPPETGLITAAIGGLLISLLGAAASRSAARPGPSSSWFTPSSRITAMTDWCWRR